MAEARKEDPPPSLPPRGRVESVRKQWSVHEDGALAYQIQNEEINQHYGMNRYNRRTVREDIPVAKIIQSEEELRQQEERMRELEALKAQAEGDEMVARQMNDQLRMEVRETPNRVELDDEELARQMQEKEKKKYERHLEKKREKKLKKERQRLEAELARDTEEAGLHVNSETGSDRIADSVESLDTQGINSRRVTPAGKIEDEGDFSDFYRLPDEMDEFTRLEIQASQDEELARLLQEQEHKRSKAEVDRSKLKRIEQQDEELAKVMQEQEKIRLKKAKQKHQQKKEAQKIKEAESLPLGASANSMYMRQPQAPRTATGTPYQQQQQQHRSPSVSPTLPGAAVGAGATRYRRNSYTQAFDSSPDPPSPPRTQPPPRPAPNRNRQDQQQQQQQYQQQSHHHHQMPSQQFSTSPPSSSHSTHQFPPPPHSSSSSSIPPPQSSSSVDSSRNLQQPPPHPAHHNQQQQQHHHLANRPPMPLPSSQNAAAPSASSSLGMSTLESARRIAAGDHNGIIVAQQQGSMPSPRIGSGGNAGRDGGGGSNVDVIRSSGRGRGQMMAGMASNAEVLHRQLSQGEYRHQGQYYPDDRFEDEAPEVGQWLNTQDEFGAPDSRSGSGSRRQQPQPHWQHATSYSDEEDDFGPHQGSPHVNGSAGFNIAAAIDPTYQKRHPEAAIFRPEDTQVKMAIPFSRSLPQADGDVEWDPGLRGSLRKTKAPIHGYQDSSTISTMGAGGDPSWGPVQGQRRGDAKSKKSSKQSSMESKKDKSGNCKQQ